MTPAGEDQTSTRGQVLRFLLVGSWNTVFGYAIYAGLTWALTPLIPYAYMVAAVLGSVVTITVAFVGNKLLVFKSRGPWFREYLRSYLVYGVTVAFGLVLLPVAVVVLTRLLGVVPAVPYVAQLLVMMVTIPTGFIGHRQFSFRRGATTRQ